MIVAFAVASLRRQWADVENRALDLHLEWGLVLASAAIVLATYAMLIEIWRRIMAAWGHATTFPTAARIWFVSGLGKYVPGKVWALTMMGVMAKHARISPLVATASSVVAGLISIVTGLGLVAVTSMDRMADAYPRVTTAAIVALGLFVAALTAAPVVVPRAAAWASRVTGREIHARNLPRRVIWMATFGTLLSWVSYGYAFRLFSDGVIGSTGGDLSAWIAVYSASYLAGFLAVPVPGGIGVREAALAALMPLLGLATVPEAVVIAVTSRLWLTVLEILPALLVLRRWRRRRPTAPTPSTSNGQT